MNSADPGLEAITNELEDQGATQDFLMDGILLKDVHFNGQHKTLVLYSNRYFTEPRSQWPFVDSVYSTVELLHVTEEYYRHFKSHKSMRINETNALYLSQPANILTNVANGYGFFSVVSYDVGKIY